MAVGDIYTSETGNLLVRFSDSSVHGGCREPSQTIGWRQRKGGKREPVFYRAGRFATDAEHNTERLKARDFDGRYR